MLSKWQINRHDSTNWKKRPQIKKEPNLYSIGCAGYITAFSQTNDNRYEIILKGLCRFELKSELNLMNGFRRGKVLWKPFRSDFEPLVLKSKEKRSVFIENLKVYLEKCLLMLIGRPLKFRVMKI